MESTLQDAVTVLLQGNILENSVQSQTDESLEVGSIGLFGGFNTVIGNVIKKSGKSGIAFGNPSTVVDGNIIEGATTAAIWVNGEKDGSCDGSVISSNSIYAVTKHGILINPTPVNGICIVGNNLNTGYGQGITVPVKNFLRNSSIGNNIITGFIGHSIIVKGENIIISGNVVTEGGENGIDCRASHSIIEGNIVTRCKAYGYNNAADFIQLRNNDLQEMH